MPANNLSTSVTFGSYATVISALPAATSISPTPGSFAIARRTVAAQPFQSGASSSTNWAFAAELLLTASDAPHAAISMVRAAAPMIGKGLMSVLRVVGSWQAVAADESSCDARPQLQHSSLAHLSCQSARSLLRDVRLNMSV